MFLNKKLLFLPVVLAISCTTPGKNQFESSRVIERIGGANETPAWATGSNPIDEEKGDVIFINTLSMSGDTRPEACTKASGDTARTEILRYIKDNLTASGQVAEASGSGDPAVESLIAFLSQGKLSGVKVVSRYWEKREESDSTGVRVLRVHCAAKVAIPKQILAQQLREATGGGGGNPEIRQKLLEQQKKFLDSIGSEPNKD